MSFAGGPVDGMVVERGQELYPPFLEDLPSPPARLYVRGDPKVLVRECISIIGTRDPTPYGAAVTRLAARVAVEKGLVVVSGGALGCDSIAGREALSCGGTHVIVLGTGADVVYPRRSEELVAGALAKGGAVVSIERWGSTPRRYAFPKRNKVIAALSRALFIAEAGIPSGTFTTAEVAESIGREVLAAPGSIFSAESRGTNYLISNGACCIADAQALEVAVSRVYGSLARMDYAERDLGLNGIQGKLFRHLIASPMGAEEIAADLKLDTRSVMELIGELSISGHIECQRDGRYAASASRLCALSSFGQNGRVT